MAILNNSFTKLKEFQIRQLIALSRKAHTPDSQEHDSVTFWNHVDHLILARETRDHGVLIDSQIPPDTGRSRMDRAITAWVGRTSTEHRILVHQEHKGSRIGPKELRVLQLQCLKNCIKALEYHKQHTFSYAIGYWGTAFQVWKLTRITEGPLKVFLWECLVGKGIDEKGSYEEVNELRENECQTYCKVISTVLENPPFPWREPLQLPYRMPKQAFAGETMGKARVVEEIKKVKEEKEKTTS